MKRTAFILSLLLISSSASAQSLSAFPWMRTEHSAAALATAGAGIVDSDNAAWSSFENAALSSFSESKMSASASYQTWSANNYANLGVAYKLGESLGVSAAVSYGIGEAMDIYNDTGHNVGTFTPNNIHAALGASVKLFDCVSIGVNGHFATETIAPKYSYTAFAADVMAMAQFGSLKVAGGVVSLGTPVKSASGNAFALPASAKLGAGYDLDVAEKINVAAYLDADYYFLHKAVSASAGFTASYDKLVHLSAGYHYGSKAAMPSFASVGLGVNMFGLSLDAAYVMASGPLGGSLCLGLGYSF